MDAARALSHLHSRGICHGDIKAVSPHSIEVTIVSNLTNLSLTSKDNVLIGNDGHATLCDFGLASGGDSFSGLNSTHYYVGSTRWCSPELLLENLRSEASDVWAFGWLVYEVCEALGKSSQLS